MTLYYAAAVSVFRFRKTSPERDRGRVFYPAAGIWGLAWGLAMGTAAAVQGIRGIFAFTAFFPYVKMMLES